ncbi:XcbB/CpsF family capsular polysaccharide biosynthesis protein [Mammaliicoccus sciuri]|uniref:accessory Sec system protein Asp2 n=1 Tax=Mammaliicoccus sciuri TaxID=1296 RepID=UPI0021D10047|nr:accessory Sec system protein Asp2 [Mammaliicoccus sciuri]UXU77267.1 XcbB/CpsF family capsular polysaccharide biosynthesis protein [Mammaliicoccus sciuri]
MTIKVATIGSCITRDNFNSKFNPYYKLFFDVIAHQNQTAIPSLMSEKLELKVTESFINKTNYVQNLLLSEFDKSFLETLKKERPQYLLMDLDPDVKFGLLKIKDNNYITNNPNFKGIDNLDNTDVLNINDDFDQYFEIWSSAIRKFFEFINNEVPGCKVVLVKGRFTDTFTDDTTLTELRIKQNIPLQNFESMNKIWDKLDDYIVDNFDVEVLDMTNTNFKLDKNHVWGPYYLHYENKFYNKFLNKLVDITYKNQNSSVENLTRSVQRVHIDDDIELLHTKTVEVILNSEKNIIEMSRRNEKIYNLYKELLKNDYILYFHKDGISKLYKRKFINELWKRDDLHQEGDVFYTLDKPLDRKENRSSTDKKLIVIFPCMPNAEVYDNYLMANRMFPKFFSGIERSLVKNVYTMRIMDLNVSHGSHYINSVNNDTFETDITNAIMRVKEQLNIDEEDIVLYGASKGGTGSLYYGSKLDLKCLAVDPIISLGEYNVKDEHFLKDLRKEDISDNINEHLKTGSKREKYIIGSENVPFNFSHISKIEGDNIVKINKVDEHIKAHPDVSRNTIPEQLMLLNKMLLNTKL